MKKNWAAEWLYAIPAIVGLGLILLSVLAVALGLDHDVAWGPKRVLALISGVVLLLLSIACASMLRGKSSGRGQPDLHRYVTGLATALCTVVVLLAYVGFVSIWKWTDWPPTTTDYDQLATSFRHGQLDIQAQLDPRLLALQNPYDPDNRKTIQGLDAIWDMTLYDGKIYLYFGAAPALLLAAAKTMFSVSVPDATLAFIFLTGLFLVETMLILFIRRHFFPHAPAWTLALALLVAGLIHPVPWMLAWPRIYEAAIAAGQFFLVSGYYFALTGIARESPRRWRLAATGALWALAVGTRATIAVPVAFLTIVLLLELRRKRRAVGAPRDLFRDAAMLMAPMAAGAMLFMWHNWARFGSLVETGLRYQITMLDLNAARGSIFSPAHILPNLYIYFLAPPIVRNVFPFIVPVRAEAAIEYFTRYSPLLYNAERVTGILYGAPFLLLGLIPAGFAIVRQLRRGSAALAAHDTEDRRALLRWVILSLLGALLLSLSTLLLFFYSTVRYGEEITTFALLLAVIGYWQAHGAAGPRRLSQVLYGIATSILAAWSIVASILLSFSSEPHWFRLHNAPLWAHLIIFFNTLARRIGL